MEGSARSSTRTVRSGTGGAAGGAAEADRSNPWGRFTAGYSRTLRSESRSCGTIR